MKYVSVVLILALYSGLTLAEPVRRGPPLMTVKTAPGAVTPSPKNISIDCSIYSDAVFVTKTISGADYTTETKLKVDEKLAEKVADAYSQKVVPVEHEKALVGSGSTVYLVYEIGKADGHRSNILYKFDAKEEAKNPSKFAEELQVVASELCGIKLK